MYLFLLVNRVYPCTPCTPISYFRQRFCAREADLAEGYTGTRKEALLCGALLTGGEFWPIMSAAIGCSMTFGIEPFFHDVPFVAMFFLDEPDDAFAASTAHGVVGDAMVLGELENGHDKATGKLSKV